MSIQRMEIKERMSRIVIHADTVYLCGQVGLDFNTDIQEQTRTMLDKVDTLLNQAGSDINHLLSATIFLADMADFEAMNEIWDNWVPAGNAPARACVKAAMARPEWKVEISVIAATISQ